MRRKKKPETFNLFNDTIKKTIVILAKKKHTTTNKYIENALQIQINEDKSLLDKEDLIKILEKKL